MKRLRSMAGKGTAISIASLLLVGMATSGAYASDGDEVVPPPSDSSVVVDTTTPAADPAPAPAPAPEPVAEPPAEPTPEANDAPVAPEADVVVEEEGAAPAQRVTTQTQKNEKVFVCKYVGTPGVDERLQTGQNPISVSVNAIQNNQWNGIVPGYFSDAHDRSYVLAYDTGQPKPNVSECPGASNPPPSKKVCDTANDLTWVKNADLSEVTITLKPSVNACDVTLHSFETEGPTWETSGTQVFVDFDSAHLTVANPTATLKVDVHGCFQQQDLAIGTKKHDGIANPVPNYPNASYPEGLIDHWNGAGTCTPPPTNTVCTTFADGGTSTDANANGWVEFASKPGGTATHVDGGLALNNVDGNSKVSWAHPTTGGSISLLGQTAIDYTHTSGGLASGPGLNAFITFAPGLTGTLVSEPNAPGYGQDWWLTGGSNAAIVAPRSDAGFGSNRHGTIDEWLALYPDATFAPTFAFAYGTGGPAAGVLHSLTIACTTYKFDTQKTVVVPPTPMVSGEQACIIDPVTGDPVKQVLLDLSNPNPTAPYTATTSVDLDVKLDGVFHETVTLTPGQTITDYEILFNEDTGDHKVEVFDGATRIYLLDAISSDCAPNEVTGTTDIKVTQGCGWITYEASYTAVIGKNEFAKPKTFTYTDEKGATQEIVMEANDANVIKTVTYAEDSGVQTATAGFKGEVMKDYTVQTDCKPAPPTKPTGGIETGDDSAFFGANDSGLQLNGGSIAGIIAILVFGTLAILWIARRRNSAV